MRSWQWLGIAACALSASVWAGQPATVVVRVSTSSTASANTAKVEQRLSQHQAEVARLQQAVKQQESHGRQAGRQLKQQDAQILKLQKQLQTLPKIVPPAGR